MRLYMPTDIVQSSTKQAFFAELLVLPADRIIGDVLLDFLQLIVVPNHPVVVPALPAKRQPILFRQRTNSSFKSANYGRQIVALWAKGILIIQWRSLLIRLIK